MAHQECKRGRAQLVGLMVLLLCCLSATASFATNYYVSRNGSNGGGTSWATAWSEFDQISWGSVRAGDTIYVDGGSSAMTYNTKLITSSNGTSSAPIIIRRSTESGRNGTVNMNGQIKIWSSNITLDGVDKSRFVINPTDSMCSVFVGYWDADASGSVVANLTIQGTYATEFGISMGVYSANTTVRSCRFVQSPGEDQLGVLAEGNVLVEYCEFTGQKDSGTIVHRDVLSVHPGTAPGSKLTIRYNNFHDAETDTIIVIPYEGTRLGSLEIYGNAFTNLDTSIKLDSARIASMDACNVYNNTFTNVGITMVGLDYPGVNFTNNTIDGSGPGPQPTPPPPTTNPTPVPTATPKPTTTPAPTAVPTANPTPAPTAIPTAVPTVIPNPTPVPTTSTGPWMQVNGKNFIPISIWGGAPTSTWVSYFKGLGINTYFSNGNDSSTDKTLLDLMQANGMHGVLKYNSTVKSHPSLIAWMLSDEPDIYGTAPSETQAQYNSIKTADPSRPVVVNMACGFYSDQSYNWIPSPLNGSRANYTGYAASGDILSFDSYPVTGWNAPQWLYIPGAATSKLFNDYGKKVKPTWAIIECSDQDLAWTAAETRGPNPAEVRFEVWDSIANGATGIGYFSIAFNPFRWENIPTDVETEMKSINANIKALTDVICSKAPTAVTATVTESAGKPVGSMLRQNGSTYYLWVLNRDMNRTNENVSVRFSSNVSSVKLYGSTRTITPSGATFTDAIPAIGVNIYMVTLSGTSTPVPTPTPIVTPNPTTTPVPTANPTPAPAGSLVAAYGFEEASGTTASDASSKANTGAISGATRTSAGRFGAALVFNGSSNMVSVADSASLDLTGAMTLEAWVYPTTSPSGWRCLLMKEAGGDCAYYLAASNGQNLPGGCVDIGGERMLAGGTRLAANTWSHVAMSYDGSTQRLYLNGAQVASRAQSGSMVASTGALRIGGNTLWGEYFAGRIDEVRIYSRALSAGEIATDMNKAVAAAAPAPTPTPAPTVTPAPTPPPTGTPAGLVAWYRFDEFAGTSASDASGKGNAGTISGATWAPNGKKGSTLVFDGVNDWVAVNNSTSLGMTGALTIEAWVFPTAAMQGWKTIVQKESTGGASYYLHASSSAGRPAAGLQIGSERILYGSAGLSANTWSHVAMTYDGATARLYINGVLKGSQSQTGSIAASTGVLHIGGNSAWGEYFAGGIDEVRLYNRALSAGEIAADMQ